MEIDPAQGTVEFYIMILLPCS